MMLLKNLPVGSAIECPDNILDIMAKCCKNDVDVNLHDEEEKKKKGNSGGRNSTGGTVNAHVALTSNVPSYADPGLYSGFLASRSTDPLQQAYAAYVQGNPRGTSAPTTPTGASTTARTMNKFAADLLNDSKGNPIPMYRVTGMNAWVSRMSPGHSVFPKNVSPDDHIIYAYYSGRDKVVKAFMYRSLPHKCVDCVHRPKCFGETCTTCSSIGHNTISCFIGKTTDIVPSEPAKSSK
jgi:hypothetical protein